jgi:hypothetical protein
MMRERRAWLRVARTFQVETSPYWGMCQVVSRLYSTGAISETTMERMLARIDRTIRRKCGARLRFPWPYLYPPADLKSRVRYALRQAEALR